MITLFLRNKGFLDMCYLYMKPGCLIRWHWRWSYSLSVVSELEFDITDLQTSACQDVQPSHWLVRETLSYDWSGGDHVIMSMSRYEVIEVSMGTSFHFNNDHLRLSLLVLVSALLHYIIGNILVPRSSCSTFYFFSLKKWICLSEYSWLKRNMWKSKSLTNK